METSWSLYQYKDELHIVPDYDDHPHKIENCSCNPEYDEADGVWVHNSFDGREEFEEGNRLPS